MTESVNESVNKLKDIIIASVAKDVLLLIDNVSDVKESVEEIKNLQQLIKESAGSYFDELADKLLSLVSNMEKELSSLGEARTNQISLNVSDNINKILIDSFSEYKKEINEALENFNKVNDKALESLNNSYHETSSAMAKLSSNNKKSLLMPAIISMQAITMIVCIILIYMVAK